MVLNAASTLGIANNYASTDARTAGSNDAGNALGSASENNIIMVVLLLVMTPVKLVMPLGRLLVKLMPR